MELKKVLRNKTTNITLFLVMCYLIAGASSVMALVTLSLDPSSSTVDVDETFTVDVVATSLVNASGFEFLITYDSGKINATSIVYGDYLEGCAGDPVEVKTRTLGEVGISEACTGEDVSATSGSTMATITFVALHSGATDLTFDTDHVTVRQNASGDLANVTTAVEDGDVTVTGPVEYGVTVSRDFSDTSVRRGANTTATLTMAIDEDFSLDDVTITENIPIGWNVTLTDNGSADTVTFTAGTGVLEYVFSDEGVDDGTVAYVLTVPANAPFATYRINGTVNNGSDNSAVSGDSRITVSSPSNNEEFKLAVPSALYANQPITVNVTNADTKDPVNKVGVDVYMGTSKNDKKVAYGTTNKNGSFTFTLTEAGKFIIYLDMSKYKEFKQAITVLTGAPVTTTTIATTTTTTKATTTTVTPTTEPITTTTAAPTTEPTTTTTTVPVVTTTQAEVTTTTQANAGGGNSSLILIGAIVLIIIIVVAYFAMQKGKGKPKEAK
jgi:hypothetical protein